MSREFVATAQEQEVSVTVTPVADGRYRVSVAGRVYEVDARRARGGAWSLLLARSRAEGEAPAAFAAHLVDVDPGSGAGGAGAVDVATGRVDLTMAVEDARRRRLSQAVGGRAKGRSSGEVIHAPIAGVVVAIGVSVGDEVQPGQAVGVLEAMKMENELKCERGGVVTAVHVSVGQSVDTGEAVITVGASAAADGDARASL